MKRMAKRMPRHLPVAQGVVLELLLFDTSIINRLMTQPKGTVWGHETHSVLNHDKIFVST